MEAGRARNPIRRIKVRRKFSSHCSFLLRNSACTCVERQEFIALKLGLSSHCYRSVAKRKFKDKKFGFGGKKRGLKSNTKDSVNDVTGFKPGFKKRGPDSGMVKR